MLRGQFYAECRTGLLPPEIEVDDELTRVLVEQVGAVDAGRLGNLVGHVTPEQQWGIDEAVCPVWVCTGDGDNRGRIKNLDRAAEAPGMDGERVTVQTEPPPDVLEPEPTKASPGRLLALGAVVSGLTGLLVIAAICVAWVGWPDPVSMNSYFDPPSTRQIAIDHALLGGAALAISAVAAFLAVRLWRAVPRSGSHLGATVVIGVVLALPVSIGFGAVGAYALSALENAQAQPPQVDTTASDVLRGSFKSPCGFTWVCAESVAKAHHVRLLSPSPEDGWGLSDIKANADGRVVIFVARGPDFCWIEASNVPLPSSTDSNTTKVSVRGTTGVLAPDPPGLYWSVNWVESGGYYYVNCLSGTDRKTMLSSLAVRD